MVRPWRVILAAVVIFLAGAITGSVATRVYAPKIIHRTHVPAPLPVGPERRQAYLSKLDRELQLTPDQRQKVEAILAESQQRMKVLWRRMEPDTKEEYRRTAREISAVLTPEQAENFKRMRHGRDRKNDKGEKGEKSERGDEKRSKTPSVEKSIKPEARLWDYECLRGG